MGPASIQSAPHHGEGAVTAIDGGLTQPRTDLPRRSTPWLAAAGLVGLTAAVDVIDPAHRHIPLCPFHAATGWWCPLCGGLRAAQAMSQGNGVAALHDNPLVIASVPVLVWLWLDWLIRSRSARPPRLVNRAVGIAVIVGLVVFTVARNLPGAQALRP